MELYDDVYIELQDNGDATCNYDVKIKENCTVEEFISDVVGKRAFRQKERGTIRITDHIFDYSGNGCEYFHGKITVNTLLKEQLNRRIKKVWASGGYGLMDYYISVEEANKAGEEMSVKDKKLKEAAELFKNVYCGEVKSIESVSSCECVPLRDKDFVERVSKMFDEAKEQFIAKNKQYKTDKSPLANFETGAKLYGGTGSYAEMYEEAKKYMGKHVAHIYNNNIYGNKVDESLRDIMIYCNIMLYMHHKAKD